MVVVLPRLQVSLSSQLSQKGGAINFYYLLSFSWNIPLAQMTRKQDQLGERQRFLTAEFGCTV